GESLGPAPGIGPSAPANRSAGGPERDVKGGGTGRGLGRGRASGFSSRASRRSDIWRISLRMSPMITRAATATARATRAIRAGRRVPRRPELELDWLMASDRRGGSADVTAWPPLTGVLWKGRV